MVDTSPLLASLLLGQRRRTDPLEAQRVFGNRLVTQGSSTAPLGSGNPLEGLARALQAGIGGLTAGLADRAEEAKGRKTIEALGNISGAKNQEELTAAIKGAEIDPDIAGPLMAQILQNRQTIFRQSEDADRVRQAYGLPPTNTPNTGTAPAGQPAGSPAGIPGQDQFQTLTSLRESGNNPTIVNKQSGAGGLYQFLPGSWDEVRRNNPDLNLPPNVTDASAELQGEAEKRFRAANGARLQQLNIPVTPATVALAHATGADGAARLLSTPPDTPMEKVVPASWIQQNPPMQGKTVGQYVQQFAQFNQPQGQATPTAPQALPQGTQTAQNGPLVPPMQDIPFPTPTRAQIEQEAQNVAAGMSRAQAAAETQKALQAEQQARREQRRIEYTQGLEQERLTQRPMAEQVVKHIGAGQDMANQARGTIGTLNQLDQLGKMVNAGGPLTPTTIALKNYAKGIGINLEALGIPDNVAPAQAYDAIVKQFALQMRNPAAGGGLPGSVSNYEDKLLQSMTPTLSMTPEGRAQLMDYQKRIAQRNIELADLASQFSESPEFKKNPQALYRHISEYVNAHPLFTAEEVKAGTAPPSQPAPAAGGYQEGQTATNPQTKERMIFRGGKWEKVGG